MMIQMQTADSDHGDIYHQVFPVSFRKLTHLLIYFEPHQTSISIRLHQFALMCLTDEVAGVWESAFEEKISAIVSVMLTNTFYSNITRMCLFLWFEGL